MTISSGIVFFPVILSVQSYLVNFTSASFPKDNGELGEFGRNALTHAGMELDTEPEHALVQRGVKHAKENLLPTKNSAI